MKKARIIKIHEIAKELGLSIQTIKNYENQGLFPRAKRDSKGWRHYTEEDLIKLKALYWDEARRVRGGK